MGVEVVHPVDSAQQRAFPATRRPHDGGNGVRVYVSSNPVYRVLAGGIRDRNIFQFQDRLLPVGNFHTFHLRATILAIQFNKKITISSSRDDDQMRSTRLGSL